MKKKQISALQLFYIMISFELGTTVVFAVGAGAKQDAWIAILVAMLGGLSLMWVYTKLSEYYPDDTLIQMIPKIIGRFLGYPLIVIYLLYFVYEAARACRDFAELIVSTILNGTPMIVIIGTFMVLIIYCFRGGIEVFGRMGELVFPIYFLTMIVIWILLYSSQLIDFDHLAPILGEGIEPVGKAAFPEIVTFPFGQLLLVTMFFPILNDKTKVRKTGMAIVLTGGILLALNTMITLSVLGADVFSREHYPFFAAARMISIADFLERVDTLVILMMVAGVFFKVGVWTYSATLTTAHLIKLRKKKFVLIPLASIITFLSLIIASNISEHLKIGLKIIPYYVFVPLQIVIPVLLLCIAITRKRLRL